MVQDTIHETIYNLQTTEDSIPFLPENFFDSLIEVRSGKVSFADLQSSAGQAHAAANRSWPLDLDLPHLRSTIR